MCHVARIRPWNELISGPFTSFQDVSVCEEMNLKCKHALVFAKGAFIEHYLCTKKKKKNKSDETGSKRLLQSVLRQS